MGGAWLVPTLVPSRWSGLTWPKISRSMISLSLVILPAQFCPHRSIFKVLLSLHLVMD